MSTYQSNATFTGVSTDIKSSKLNTQTISSQSIQTLALTSSLYNNNLLNGYSAVQTTLYSPSTLKNATTFAGFLYTVPNYTPVALGTADPNFFVFPTGSIVLGILASNLVRANAFSATNFSVGTALYAATPVVLSSLLALTTAALVNGAGLAVGGGGVAAGNSLVDSPRVNSALGGTGTALVIAGSLATPVNCGCALTCVGTNGANDGLVVKLTYLVPN